MDYPILSREDSIIYDGWGYDYNSPEVIIRLLEYGIPDAFCDEARAMMNYWGDSAHIMEYHGKLVLTNGARILTYYGNRGPRGIFDSWEALEHWLVVQAKELSNFSTLLSWKEQ